MLNQNSLTEEIRAAYLAEHKQSPTRAKAIESFCEFAESWLAKSGIIGLAQNPDGMSIRFSDGKESVLFTAVSTVDQSQFFSSVGVTGSAGGSVRGAGAVKDDSISITG